MGVGSSSEMKIIVKVGAATAQRLGEHGLKIDSEKQHGAGALEWQLLRDYKLFVLGAVMGVIFILIALSLLKIYAETWTKTNAQRTVGRGNQHDD